MTASLIAAIERLPPRVRRVVAGAVAVLLLAAAITALTLQARPASVTRRSTPTALTLQARPASVTRRSTPTAPAESKQRSGRPVPRSVRPPVSATGLRRASGVAGRFLVAYLQFAYGRVSARSVGAITGGLRSQLLRERAELTPAERRRQPRVVSLRAVGSTPGFVVATATVSDGGIAAYRLRFALQERAGRWLVSGVQED
jgi:hypothetical protein